MPIPCSLNVAKYPGSSEIEGREGTTDIYEVEHTLHQPVTPNSGENSGVRVHSPFRVVACIDKATPGLQKALCDGENIGDIVVQYYRIDPETRGQAPYYKTTLRRARCVDVRPYVPMTFVPANEPYRHMVQYSFVYEEIEWNYEVDQVVEMDKWRAPGA
jgi:type VI secretion system secreted protein Hcp